MGVFLQWSATTEKNDMLGASLAMPSRLGSVVIGNQTGAVGAVDEAGKDDGNDVSSDVLLSAPPRGMPAASSSSRKRALGEEDGCHCRRGGNNERTIVKGNYIDEEGRDDIEEGGDEMEEGRERSYTRSSGGTVSNLHEVDNDVLILFKQRDRYYTSSSSSGRNGKVGKSSSEEVDDRDSIRAHAEKVLYLSP